jgi:DNA mismatch repair protein MutL
MIFSEDEMPEEKLIVDHFVPVDKNDFTDRPNTRFRGKHLPSFSEEEIDNIFGGLTDDIIIPEQHKISPPFEKETATEFLHKLDTKDEDSEAEVSSFIVQLHNRYILSQIKSGLMIIDQHVAHERVLYEKALNRLETDIPFSQQLLFSKKIELDPARYDLLKELNDYLTKIGFQLKYSGKRSVTIEGVPDDVKKGNEENLLLEILDEYVENNREKKLDELDNIAKSYSCKTAIKAGDNLVEKEMRLLIDQLFATSMPYVCPHGRPIVVKISLNEFDRRFGRT